MKFILLVLIGGFTSLLLAEHGPDGTASISPVASTFKVEEIGRLKGEEITQDKFGSFATYIAPNEHMNHLFEACFPKEGGAYISVGTFRGMNVASSGKVSHLVLMDINPTIAYFNRVNIQLINKASDRFEYLSYLFSGKANPDLENKVRRGEMKLSEFLLSIPKSLNPVSDWKGLGAVLDDDQTKHLTNYCSVRTLGDLQYEFRHYSVAGTEDQTFIGNNDRFTKLKELVSQNKVTVLAGDVAGQETLKNLGDTFRRQGTQLAAMDVSNVPDYLHSETIKTMLSNARSLPFRENGWFFFTGIGANNFTRPEGFKPVSGDSWVYQAVPRSYLEGMSALPYGGYSANTTDGKAHKMVPDPGNPNGVTMFYTPEDAPCTPKPN